MMIHNTDTSFMKAATVEEPFAQLRASHRFSVPGCEIHSKAGLQKMLCLKVTLWALASGCVLNGVFFGGNVAFRNMQEHAVALQVRSVECSILVHALAHRGRKELREFIFPFCKTM